MSSAGFTSGGTLAERFRAHAGDDHSLYAFAMRGMADDWEAGGVVRRICAGWEDAPQGSVVQLCLLAGVFRIVLRQEAPELAPYYESLGGTARPERVWPVMRAVMSSHVADLQEALRVAPQTNEVGRSAALLVGIFEAVRRSGLTKIRLLEPGASAGLNLLVNRFRFENPSWSFGPVDSPLVMRDGIEGVVTPQRFSVASRRGCDLEPVDATTPDGQLRLISFVWPFRVDRRADRAELSVDGDVLAVVHVTMEYPKDRPGGADRAELSVDAGVLAVVAHHGRTVLSADR